MNKAKRRNIIKCAMRTCKNEKIVGENEDENNKPKKLFFHFPKNLKRLVFFFFERVLYLLCLIYVFFRCSDWIKATKRDDLINKEPRSVSQHYRIQVCSDHFTTQSYIPPHFVRLISSAVPTITDEISLNATMPIKQEFQIITDPSMFQTASSVITEPKLEIVQPDPTSSPPVSSDSQQKVESSNKTDFSFFFFLQIFINKSTQTRNYIFNSPRTIKLLQENRNLTRRIVAIRNQKQKEISDEELFDLCEARFGSIGTRFVAEAKLWKAKQKIVQ